MNSGKSEHADCAPNHVRGPDFRQVPAGKSAVKCQLLSTVPGDWFAAEAVERYNTLLYSVSLAEYSVSW